MKIYIRVISLLLCFTAALTLFACQPDINPADTTVENTTATQSITEANARTTEQANTDKNTPTPPQVSAEGAEITAQPESICEKSIRQIRNEDKLDVLIYAEVEENSNVYICDYKGNVLSCEKSVGPCYYGVMELGENEEKDIYIYAQAPGKALSEHSYMRLCHTDEIGESTFVGKNSRLYLNWYDHHYKGDVTAKKDLMLYVKKTLREQLTQVRAKTGKNTKMIFVIATNPATIYHDEQYEEPFGRGDYFEETTTTQFVDYMKDNKDIYVVDCRKVLTEHKDEYIFYQTDTHWTQLGAFYAYTEMMKYVESDFPSARTYKLTNYKIEYNWRAGDLLSGSFLNGYGEGMREWAPFISAKNIRTYTPSCPTAYIVGDSYMGAIKLFLEDTFKACYYNTDGTNPPLYTYHFDNLQTWQPDYLIFVFTERNISSSLYELYGNNTITE